MARHPLTQATQHAPHAVAAHLADHILLHPATADAHTAPSLGAITLAPHQLEAVEQLRTLLHTHGGALLADDVGLGKTYVALAVARAYRTPVIVAPAALRTQWRHACARTARPLPVHSLQRLSTTPLTVDPRPDLVILDEAHHLRTPTTRRYRHAAELCRHAHVLLLTATPVHNHARDLHHLLALFATPQLLGDRDARTRCIVRRTATALRETPRALAPPPVHAPREWPLTPSSHTPRIAQALEALPLPTTPAVAALLRLHLERHWHSSGGALVHALARLRARLTAIDRAAEEGRSLDARTIARQLAGIDALQPSLFDDGTTLAAPDAHTLRAAARIALDAVTQLRALAAVDAPRADTERAQRLLDICKAHAPAPVIAFSQFTATVRALASCLRQVPGVATLVGQRATIASGPIDRQALLRLVAPRAQHAPAPPPHQRVRLLLATDVAGEGLDLTDAQAVVHLDLPWTPPRLAQRLGRVARIGSTHRAVSVHLLRPPMVAPQVGALRRKQADADALLGGSSLPSLVGDVGAPSTDTALTRTRDHEALRAIARRWRAREAPSSPSRSALLGCDTTGGARALAVVALREGPRLACCTISPSGVARVSTQPRAIVRVARALDRVLETASRTGVDGTCAGHGAIVRAVVRALVTWRDQERVREAGLAAPGAEASSVRSVVERATAMIDRLVREAAFADRHALTPLLRDARRALRAVRGAGSLARLAALLAHPPPKERDAIARWLGACAGLATAPAGVHRGPSRPRRVQWLLVAAPVDGLTLAGAGRRTNRAGHSAV
ncbi:MAG: DEAD/DEAH box helicase [Gemmatimonadaceae bacterium]|jgi:superfamily II DNA or RNA helicase|nr:DEAD/DEAH box helicase [Gemmatimonadaceae bacterium]